MSRARSRAAEPAEPDAEASAEAPDTATPDGPVEPQPERRGDPDVWAPASASVEAVLISARRMRDQLSENLEVTQAALAEARAALVVEQRAHEATRLALGEREEAYARDRAAWDDERAALLAGGG